MAASQFQTDDLMTALLKQSGITDPKELKAAERMLRSMGASEADPLDTIDGLLMPDGYERRPVPMSEWLSDPQYLGEEVLSDLYPEWKDALTRFFDGHYWLMLLTGAMGTGKCVREGTLIPTTHGLLPIEAAVAGVGTMQVMTREWRLLPITAGHVLGEHETIRVRVRFGYELEGRPDHRVVILDGLDLIWRRLGDLKVNDVVVVQRGTELWGQEACTPVEAEALGIWTGDGHFDRRGGRERAVCISVGNHEMEFQRVVREVFGALGHTFVSHRRTCQVVQITSWSLVERWKRWGCVSGAENKAVPWVVMRAPRASVTAFLRGLFDTDGWVKADGTQVEFSTISARLAYEVQALLLNLGIVASRSFSPYTGNGCWKVRLIGRLARERFAEQIGFRHERKRHRLEDGLARPRDVRRYGAGLDVVLSGLHTLMQSAWDHLPRPRKASRQMFAARCAREDVTASVMHKAVALIRSRGGRVPLALAQIADRDYLTLRVERIEQSRGRCYDLSVPPDESYVAAGFVSHNTTAANIAFLRVLYELSCMRDPSKTLGLAAKSPIYLVYMGTTEKQVKRAAYATIEGLLMQSPYFKQHFPPEAGIRSELRFSKRVTVFPGAAYTGTILGVNLLGGMIDEANAMLVSVAGIMAERAKLSGAEAFDQAQQLFNNLVRRAKSRFMKGGRMPIKVMVLANRNYPGEFTERLEKDPDPGIFKLNLARWEVNCAKQEYSQEVFYVEVGTMGTPSRMWGKVRPDPAVISGELLDVPMDFYQDFLTDLEGSIRDYGGRSTVGTATFIKNRDRLLDAVAKDQAETQRVHPASHLIFTRGMGDITIGELIKEQLCVQDTSGKWRPRYHADAARVIHLDPGATLDRYGLVMGCAAEDVIVTRRVGESLMDEAAPKVFIDLMLGIIAPKGSEVDFGAVRAIIRELREWGFGIELITEDTWQSIDNQQRLKDAGFSVADLSVDATEDPYNSLKLALDEGRLRLYRYWPALIEVLHLRRVQKSRSGGGSLSKFKIDHPSVMLNEQGQMVRGSKDIADGLAGCVWNLTKPQLRPRARVLTTKKPQTEEEATTIDARALFAAGLMQSFGE